VLDVEVVGAGLAPQAPPAAEIERLLALALASAGIEDGHVAVQFVGPDEIAQLNVRHRGKEGPTDVLSFPIDGEPAGAGAPRGEGPGPAGAVELGDVVICPAHTVDVREAIVHGALHLTGMDHERDEGEMLALQRELLVWDSRAEGS
jgi:probable rRNA maturation factor